MLLFTVIPTHPAPCAEAQVQRGQSALAQDAMTVELFPHVESGPCSDFPLCSTLSDYFACI